MLLLHRTSHFSDLFKIISCCSSFSTALSVMLSVISLTCLKIKATLFFRLKYCAEPFVQSKNFDILKNVSVKFFSQKKFVFEKKYFN